MRVVSLVPSVTETVLALGVTPVGVTRFCEHPELPQVGGTKDPDLDAVIALEPDLVVLCVEENRRDDADALTAAGVPTLALSIDGVDDVAPAVETLAAHVGARVPAGWVESFPAAVGAPGRRAFVPIWRRPWMTLSAGTYGASVLRRIGFTAVPERTAERYPEVGLDAAAALAPDLVIAPSEPYPFGPRHVAELEAVAPVVLVDGQDLFWWGIRTPAALRRLADALGASISPR